MTPSSLLGPLAVLAGFVGCGSSSDADPATPAKNSYDVQNLTTQRELGTVLAFNARGVIVQPVLNNPEPTVAVLTPKP